MTISTATNILCERENAPAIPMGESIRACAKAGFKNLDFGFAELAFFSERFRSEAWQAEMEEYKTLAEELGIRFVQGHGSIFDFGKKDGSYEERFELLHKSIKGAAMLDIPWLVVHPSTFVEEGKKLEATHEKNVAFFKELSSYCENYGVGIAIENMWGKTKDGVPRYAIRAEELLELIEDVGKKNVEACWDVEHASVEKLDQGGSIIKLGKHIKVTHISDETGADNIHILPFTGNVHWEEILDAFARIDYEGTLSLEIQHFLPKMPPALIEDAMKLAYRVGSYLVERLEEKKSLLRQNGASR